MNAPEEDQDVKLQKASAELLADLQLSLPPFLRTTAPSGLKRIRRRVRTRETERLVALLEPFQELPQLLDPHLQQLVPILADAFLECLQSKRPSPSRPHSQLLMTNSRAICKILYSFCKIRGEKVIVRFLGTEAKHLELILSAVETQSRLEDEDPKPEILETWEWEERYIALLWLSQLLFAPFDLASISSQATIISHQGTDNLSVDIPDLIWPQDVPSITLRVVPLALRYISAPGKERDAARVLLVRLAMRKDMQELGVFHALINWALCRLRMSPNLANSTYYYIGIISFLAGILKSSIGTSNIDSYLPSIFEVIQDLCTSENGFFKKMTASPAVRKANITVLRVISVLALQNVGVKGSIDMVEWTIGYLLDSLADPATPVRIAISKALSVITLKLAPDMALQVVEELLSALKKDVLTIRNGPSHLRATDLSAVNPLEWHGLILTLSQLLYRRSPPASALSHIIDSLIDGLNFEQRSTSGSSVGANVRDAANLGIWSLARRYTTSELQAIDGMRSNEASRDSNEKLSILQILAAELVVSASLDPAGNIRRGSSAALQELIGRHPHTVVEGIRLVQVVEYSSVALRSKSILVVAVEAAGLDETYSRKILLGLESWRGVGDPDAAARRNVAIAFEIVVQVLIARTSNDMEFAWDEFRRRVSGLGERLKYIQDRQVDERHGLILCVASTIKCLKGIFHDDKSASLMVYRSLASGEIKSLVVSILENAKNTPYRRPELIAEAVSRLLIATYPILNSTSSHEASSSQFDTIDLGTNPLLGEDPTSDKIRSLAGQLLGEWLRLAEPEVTEATSQAASKFFLLLSLPQKNNLILTWIVIISEDQGTRDGQDKGIISTLFQVFPEAGLMQEGIIEAIHKRWNSTHNIESRAAILLHLGLSSAIFSHMERFVYIIAQGLDDYTTDLRGDIGSLVRIEALKVAALIWRGAKKLGDTGVGIFKKLYPRVLRLSAEKLDKVRNEAQRSLANTLESSEQFITFKCYSSSSKTYFYSLLTMVTSPLVAGVEFDSQWYEDLLQGYITSADTGSEEIVRASRAALVEFCDNEDGQNGKVVCNALLAIMKINIKNDRIVISCMEIASFLLDYKIMQRSQINWRSLYALVQNAHYQTGNMRKLEAAVKLYGGLVEVYPEAMQKLTSLLLHKYPKVRNEAADVIFIKSGVGKGVNWAKAKQVDLNRLRDSLAAMKPITS